MAISFIINSTGKPKSLYDMSSKEINSLCSLLSGSVNNLYKSEVKIIKNGGHPVKLSELSVDALSVLKTSVINYKMGHITEVHMHYTNEETNLIVAMIKCNMNVSQTARELGLTRDKVREDIKRFYNKWGIDLSSYSGLNRAYVFALGS